MPDFKFTLQQLADMLEHETMRRAGVLREIDARLDAGRQAVDSVRGEIDRAYGLQGEKLAAGKQFGVADLHSVRVFAGERLRELQTRQEAASGVEKEYEQQRELLSEGMAAQKAVEQVRERRLREHQSGQLRKSEQEADALWLGARAAVLGEEDNG